MLVLDGYLTCGLLMLSVLYCRRSEMTQWSSMVPPGACYYCRTTSRSSRCRQDYQSCVIKLPLSPCVVALHLMRQRVSPAMPPAAWSLYISLKHLGSLCL